MPDTRRAPPEPTGRDPAAGFQGTGGILGMPFQAVNFAVIAVTTSNVLQTIDSMGL